VNEGHLSNASSQRRLKEREKLRREQAKVDLGEVLSTPAGRRFLWSLLAEDTQVFDVTVSDEPMALARHSGIRLVGVRLLTAAQEQHPELFLAMWQEAVRAAREEALHRRDAEGAPAAAGPGRAATAVEPQEEDNQDG
jgi:hypothetical protein